jgi:putative ABC transport system permease protein
MLRLAVLGIRGRIGAFAGAFVALFVAAVLVMACGVLLESGIRAHAPVERYAAAAAVIAGDQSVGEDNDVVLTERARVDASLAERVGGIADYASPGRGVTAHGWSSAALAPYSLTRGRAPERPGEAVAAYPARLGSRVQLGDSSARIVGVAGARSRERVVFVTDAEAIRRSGHPGRADAIGVLPRPGETRDAAIARVKAAVAAHGASAASASGAAPTPRVLTGRDRGQAEDLDVQEARSTLIAVAGAFGGLALLIAMFVVASTLGLSILQREREIALLRAIAATPGQVRRMIAWEALVLALVASAAGLWPGAVLGRELGGALARHGVAPDDLVIHAGPIPMIVAVGGGVLTALLAVFSAGRRAARVRPTRALQDAVVEPRLLGPVRGLGGLLALGGGIALMIVSMSTSGETAATTAAVTSFVLVLAAAFLGPLIARASALLPGALIARLAPIGGFLAVSNLGAAARRFSSATTPLVLTVAMAFSLLFVNTTQDHATSKQTRAALRGDLAVTGDLTPGALERVRATRGVDSAAALTATSLGPSLGAGYDVLPAQVLDVGGASRSGAAAVRPGGIDVGVVAGDVAALRGDAIALSKDRAGHAHAHVGDRVRIALGDGSPATARVVAIYDRQLAFGDAVLSPALAAGHLTEDRLGLISVATRHPAAVAKRLRADGFHVSNRAELASETDQQRETNRWLNGVLALVVFAFTSIAVVNTLTMIALQRGREIGLLRLVGGTARQVLAMTRWEALIAVATGIGAGIAISLATLIPFSIALNTTPYVPLDQAAAIVGVTAVLGLLAAQLPTRLGLRRRPVEAIGLRD